MAFALSNSGIAARRKAAELLSTTGALVLGVGIGLLLPAAGAPFAWVAVILGILSHGWGMYEKNRIEALAGEEPRWWHRVLYWGCWAALAALVIYLVAQLVRL
jgi:hypothetical protein